MTNSVGPDETARYEPLIRIYTVCTYLSVWSAALKVLLLDKEVFVCVEVFTAQSIQWGHVECGQLPNHTFTAQA